jgi:hypothetical protein
MISHTERKKRKLLELRKPSYAKLFGLDYYFSFMHATFSPCDVRAWIRKRAYLGRSGSCSSKISISTLKHLAKKVDSPLNRKKFKNLHD